MEDLLLESVQKGMSMKAVKGAFPTYAFAEYTLPRGCGRCGTHCLQRSSGKDIDRHETKMWSLSGHCILQ